MVKFELYFLLELKNYCYFQVQVCSERKSDCLTQEDIEKANCCV